MRIHIFGILGFLGASLPAPFCAQADELRVINYKQVPGIFSTLTGVSVQRTDVREYTSANASRFPQYGLLHEATSSFLLASLSLSSYYCQHLLDDEKRREPAVRWVYGSTDFSLPLAQYQDMTRVGKLISDMTRQLWGRSATQEEAAIFAEEFGGWASDVTAFTDGGLDEALNTACATLLSSPEIWLETY